MRVRLKENIEGTDDNFCVYVNLFGLSQMRCAHSSHSFLIYVVNVFFFPLFFLLFFPFMYLRNNKINKRNRKWNESDVCTQIRVQLLYVPALMVVLCIKFIAGDFFMFFFLFFYLWFFLLTFMVIFVLFMHEMRSERESSKMCEWFTFFASRI